MALPAQIGDDVSFTTLLYSATARRAFDTVEKVQRVTSIMFVASPNNSGSVWIGDSISCPLELVAGKAFTVNITRRDRFFYYMDTAGDSVVAVTVMTNSQACGS